MGVNNRKRRAARQRKEQRARRPEPSGGTRQKPRESWDADEAGAEVSRSVLFTLRVLGLKKLTEPAVAHAADRLVARVAPYPRHVVEIVLHDLVATVVSEVVAGGWSPGDLGELVGRNLGSAHLQALAAALREDERRHLRGQEWRDAIDRVDGGRTLPVDVSGVVALLGVLAVLRGAPLLTDVLTSTASSGPEHPKLARVRALLAKAESTEFDEEAEALSAKAQELISRYALDRLVAQGPSAGRDDLAVRRIWLDPPYVHAKTLLVAVVAAANRCRAASADRLGFSVVVGSPADLEVVELLVTSLLVQADAAMLRHGRRTTASGAARTKSFRQSFLTAYATRIGDRLTAATHAAASATDADLLPVLRSQEAAVAEEFDRLVPHTRGRSVSVSNGDGWFAGLAAADQATLDVSPRLRRAD